MIFYLCKRGILNHANRDTCRLFSQGKLALFNLCAVHDEFLLSV